MSAFSILNETNELDRNILKKLFKIKGNEISMMLKRGYSTDEIMIISYENMGNNGNYFKSFNGNALIPYFLYEELTPINYILLSDNNIDRVEDKFNKFLEFRRNYNLFRTREEFSFVWRHNESKELVAVMYLNSGDGSAVTTTVYGRIIKPIIVGNTYGNNLVIYGNNQGLPVRGSDNSIVIKHFITISEKPIGTDNDEFNNERTKGIIFEDFIDSNLAFQSPLHCLSPIDSEYIPPQKSSEWAKEEGLQANKLPAIMQKDPHSKFHNASTSGIFKLNIVNSTYEKNTIYRVIINPRKLKKDK